MRTNTAVFDFDSMLQGEDAQCCRNRQHVKLSSKASTGESSNTVFEDSLASII